MASGLDLGWGVAEERFALLEEALPVPSHVRNDDDKERAMTEMIIGLDPHKASNTIAVLDRDETLLLQQRFDNTADGMVAMVEAVAEFSDRVWAVEGANGVGRSVAQRLVAAGETVVDVPAKLATRVEIGIQSTRDNLLLAANRKHTAAQNKRAIQVAKDAG